MPWQLIFTSTPTGLTPGRSGFCTVARDRALREPLVAQVERLSAFEASALSEGVFLFRRVSVGDETYGVITCARRAGVDYTQRRNMLAHHLIFSAAEMQALGGRTPPARIARLWKFCESWNAPARFFEAEEKIPLSAFRFFGEPNALPARTWESLTRDAANAAHPLVDTPTVFSGTADTPTRLRLFEESAALADTRAWDYTWSTGVADAPLQWTFGVGASALAVSAGLRPPAGMAHALAQAARHGMLLRAPRARAAAFDRTESKKAPAWIWVIAGLALAGLAAGAVFLLASKPDRAPQEAPPTPLAVAPLNLNAVAPAVPAPVAPPPAPEAPSQPPAASAVPAVVLPTPARTPAPPPPERAPLFPTQETVFIVGSWQAGADGDDFSERIFVFDAPPQLARFFGETPPERVDIAPLDTALAARAPLAHPVRPESDYVRGVSLVLHAQARDVPFNAQIDFLDGDRLRLTRRFYGAPARDDSIALRFVKQNTPPLSVHIIAADARFDRALRLPLRTRDLAYFGVRGDTAYFHPTLKTTLEKLSANAPCVFELASARGEIVARGDTLPAPDRATALRRLNADIAQAARARETELQSGYPSDKPSATADRLSALEQARERLASRNWVAVCAPWRLSLVAPADGAERKIPLIEFANRR